MSLDEKHAVDQDAARRQWRDLHHLVLRLGGYVEYVPPEPGLPDMCFTANAGLYHDGKVVLSKFRYPERQKEEDHFLAAFRRLGYEVMVPGRDFEGAGDAFIVNDILFLGSGFRTDRRVADEVMEFFGLRTLIRCDLIDPYFYHLDTCFCPLTDDKILYYPGAFSKETLRALGKSAFRLIEVDEAEAKRFACNAVVLIPNKPDTTHVILPAGSDRTAESLRKFGIRAHQTPMDQFLKAGGACKCLTLKIGEHS